MKITRYFQSCLLVEDEGTRILIDPSGHEKDRDFGDLSAVLYTHEHSDHFDAEMAQEFVEQGIAPVYANASTAKLIKASKTVVKDGQEFDINSLNIKAVELPHCPMPDGSDGPQNTGYLVGKKLFHAGDGKELANLRVDILAAAMLGPDVSVRDTCDFAKQVSAKTVIPIHYDSFSAKPDFFVSVTGWFKMPFQVRPLEIGESAQF
jgi:L-ascorbate metabolism protein UlaG (beta-lactamase superfamily)